MTDSNAQVAFHARNILRAWEMTSDREKSAGAVWYDDTADLVGSFWVGHADAALGIFAALSPRISVAADLAATRIVIDAARAGEPMPARAGQALRANIVKAWRIAQGEKPLDVLGGRKTRAFYRNLNGNTLAVTIDAWAMKVAGHHRNGVSDRQYRLLTAAYRAAAREAGTDPRTMQSATWISARGSAA